MSGIDEIANRMNVVKVQIANDQPVTDQPTWADVQHLLSCIEGRGVDDLPRGYWPTLIDRGDGVKGHYCIGRLINPAESVWHFWNHGKWLSAGQVFVGRDVALATLDKIRAGSVATTPTAGGERCAECGHSNVGAKGYCKEPVSVPDSCRVGLCGCKCVFPAPQEFPACNHERELGKKVFGCFDCYPPSTATTSAVVEAGLEYEKGFEAGCAFAMSRPMLAAEEAAKAVIDEIWGDAMKLAQSFVDANVRNYNDHKGVESLERVYDAKRDTAQQIVNQMKNFNEARWHKPKSVIEILSRYFPPTEAVIPVEQLAKQASEFAEKCYTEQSRQQAEIERLKAEVARLTEDLKVGELCEECEQFTNEPDGNPRTFTVCGVCWNKQQVKLSTARANAIDEALDEVTALRKAYPESVFTPIADNETSQTQEQWPGLVDRISAHMARHLLDVLAAALEALKQKQT